MENKKGISIFQKYLTVWVIFCMVFQRYALYPHMTVRQNMGFALKLKKVPKAEIKKKVEEVAQILDVTQYLDRKPKALSGGQRQRVAIAERWSEIQTYF